jgi:hypothetical protein
MNSHPERRQRRCAWCAISLAGVLALAVAPMTAVQAAGATKSTTARQHFAGTWNRYPEFGEQPDPKIPAPPAVPPPPLKPEYLDAWQAAQKAAQEADARGQPLFTDYVRCLPDGMPAMMMAMFPIEVLETPGQITIIEEAYNQVRRIYLNEKQLDAADAEPGYWGHSVGHWEGDTLVVDTVGIKDYVRFRGAPHSAQMHIGERITLVSADLMQDDITVTDPVYLTQPWNFSYAYTRRPGYKMLEYVCDSNREYKDPNTGGTRLKLGDH